MSTIPADDKARIEAYWDFHNHFPSDLLAAEATAIEGGVRCYLGTCAALKDKKTGKRVIVLAHTADALTDFMRAHGTENLTPEHFKAVALLPQKVVTVVDDL